MKKSIIVIIGVILLIIAIFFDREIASSVVNYRSTLLTGFMNIISFLGSALIVTILTTLLFLYDKKKRNYIPVLWLTLAVSLAITIGLKYLVTRPRPNILPLASEISYSFPSGHATAIFAPLLLIDKLFPKLKWLWLSLSILVLLSRIYLGVHYMSDVIAGALIGYLVGMLILSITKNI